MEMLVTRSSMISTTTGSRCSAISFCVIEQPHHVPVNTRGRGCAPWGCGGPCRRPVPVHKRSVPRPAHALPLCVPVPPHPCTPARARSARRPSAACPRPCLPPAHPHPCAPHLPLCPTPARTPHLSAGGGWHTTQTAAQANPGAYAKGWPSQRRIPRGNRGPLLALLLRLLTRLPAFLDCFAYLPRTIDQEELLLLALAKSPPCQSDALRDIDRPTSIQSSGPRAPKGFPQVSSCGLPPP